MTIKNQFQEIIDFLEVNKSKKISSILDEVKILASKKQNSKCFEVDEDGKVTRIFCYYHKQWEDLSTHEYGTKKHSSSGYNSMCKIGVRNWTSQQNEKKKALTNLLSDLTSGTISVDDLPQIQLEIEENAKRIVPL